MSRSTEKSKNVNKTNKEAKPDKKNGIFKVRDVTYLQSLSRKEVFSYIRGLHKFLKKQNKKLEKYKQKWSDLKGKPQDSSAAKHEEAKQISEEPKSFIDEIKQAAEEAQNENGFIYEPTSGLYYDQKTGYYYNAEYGLYYDGNTGCYYNYDQQKQEFVFHSQAQVETDEQDKVHEKNSASKKHESQRRRHRKYYDYDREDRHDNVRRVKKRTRRSPSDESRHNREDGELSSDENSSNGYNKRENSADDFSDFEEEEIADLADKYPPSLRLVVQETNLTKLQVGQLNLITFKGGTLGREGDHDVLIPDVNVSKYHLRFSYDEQKKIYQCIDLGSRNGTILNGQRMSNALQESDLFDVLHGSVIQVSQTKLLCHVHKGNKTCGHCEPGLIMEQKSKEKVTTLTHKQQLKKLQKRYGLENERFVEKKSDPNYNDRASIRRVKVGSTNDCEKTDVASTEKEISSENKGFKMLSKLGWIKGEALGKNNAGLLEPINVSNNAAKVGLGCTDRPQIESINVSKSYTKKLETWKKTQERYKSVKEDIFAEEDENDDD